MPQKTLIQLRRGLKAELPTLQDGEPGFCTDTHELYIGHNATNHLIAGSGGGGTGDMTKATYDTNDNGSVDSAEAINGIASAGMDKYYGTDFNETVGFHNLPVDRALFGFRLSASSTEPIPSSDQTSVTTLFLLPYVSRLYTHYYNSRWPVFSSPMIYVYLTDSQSATLTNGSPIVTNLERTYGMIVGMEVSGSGIPGGTTISSINSDTQITLSANATASGGSTLTFKLPASSVYDLFVYYGGDSNRYQIIKWSNNTTRATALTRLEGVLVKSGDTGKRYVGTFATTATSGQTEDSLQNRLVYSHYNRVPRAVVKMTTIGTYSSSNTNWENLMNSATTRVSFVLGETQDVVVQARIAVQGSSASAYGYIGVGLDQTGSSGTVDFFNGTAWANIGAYYAGPLLGYHYIQPVEKTYGASCTFADIVSGNQYMIVSGSLFI